MAPPQTRPGTQLTPFSSAFTVLSDDKNNGGPPSGSFFPVLRKRSTMPDTASPMTITQVKDISVVEFTNNKILDEANIEEIKTSLFGLIDSKTTPKLLLDFGNVDHMSSAALGTLINVSNRVKDKNGQLRLANIKPQIFEVFVITKLNKLFRILPTRQEAMASFVQ